MRGNLFQMKQTDKKLNRLTGLFVRILLRPQVRYMAPERSSEILSEPSIIIANHTSHLDGPFLNTAMKQNDIHSLAAKDRFEQRGFGFFLRHTGCIPIDRNNLDTSWIHDSLEILHKEHEHVAIYPEGQHGNHRHQLPFKPGVVMLAAVAKVPLVMVYIDGPLKLFRQNRMIVSSPFYLQVPSGPLSAETVKELTSFLERKMENMMLKLVLNQD